MLQFKCVKICIFAFSEIHQSECLNLLVYFWEFYFTRLTRQFIELLKLLTSQIWFNGSYVR